MSNVVELASYRASPIDKTRYEHFCEARRRFLTATSDWIINEMPPSDLIVNEIDASVTGIQSMQALAVPDQED